MPEIGSLLIGDQPEVWASLGFTVDGSDCHVSGVRHQLGGELKGIRAWGLRGVDGHDPVDGLPSDLPVADAAPTPEHANGVVSLDHVVLMTPDLGRTIDALQSIGLDLRRTRDAGTYGTPMRQAFFRMGPVILEVVGPPEPTGAQAARFFGLAFTVRDLDETAAHLGDRLHAAKDAVQPGRRIATLDKGAGSTVAIAFMSPGEADGS
jgi:hypothetical protein